MSRTTHTKEATLSGFWRNMTIHTWREMPLRFEEVAHLRLLQLHQRQPCPGSCPTKGLLDCDPSPLHQSRRIREAQLLLVQPRGVFCAILGGCRYSCAQCLVPSEKGSEELRRSKLRLVRDTDAEYEHHEAHARGQLSILHQCPSVNHGPRVTRMKRKRRVGTHALHLNCEL